MNNKIKTSIILIACICISLNISSCTTSNTKLLEGSAAAIMSEVRKQVSFPAMMQIDSFATNGEDTLKNYYGIQNGDDIGDFCILIPQEDNYTEVAIFKIDETSNNSYDIVLKATQKRYNDLYSACKAYNPEKIAGLKNRILMRYKNAVVFIVYDKKENETIVKTIDNFSKVIL